MKACEIIHSFPGIRGRLRAMLFINNFPLLQIREQTNQNPIPC